MEDLNLLQEDSLERCPFCGSTVILVTAHGQHTDKHRFLCRSEDCLMGDFEITMEGKERVKEWWNNRR